MKNKIGFIIKVVISILIGGLSFYLLKVVNDLNILPTKFFIILSSIIVILLVLLLCL